MDRLGIAFLTWRRALARRLVPYGITLKQAFVLGRLEKQDYLLPSQIARLLFCDRPTATVIVRNMARKGWVERQQDEEDRRQKRVLLTAEGRAKLEEVRAHVWRPVRASFDPLGCFDEAERRELDRLLAKLGKHLQQANQPGVETPG
jgi:DNA-binding MarR family transcriptional regulator